MDRIKAFFQKLWNNPQDFKRLRWLSYSLWGFAIVGVISASIIFLVYSQGELPSFTELENPQYDLASIVYSDDQTAFGKYYIENREAIDYKNLSPNIIEALLSTEDIRYYNHSGIDVIALFRVIFKTLLFSDQSSGGGSTISQQLAKLLFKRETLRGLNKIERAKALLSIKFREWITAVRLEKQYTKEEIMTMYLNKFEFINGAHGIQAAAQVYFNKNQKDLDIHEAATLVGMLKNPSKFNPVRFPEESLVRRNTVIKLMARNGKINRTQRDTLIAKPLDMSSFNRETHVDGLAPYFRSELTKWLQNLLDQSEYYKPEGVPYNIYRDGLKIYTTINLNFQAHAEAAVQEHMAKNQQRYWRVWGKRNPITYDLNPKKNPEDSLKVAIRLETVERRIRTLDVYNELFKKYFEKLSGETSEKFEVVLNEPIVRQFVTKPGYINEVDENLKGKFQRLLNSNYGQKIRQNWELFHEELRTKLAEEKEVKVFAYNPEKYEVKELSLLDSLMHQTRILQAGLLSMDPRNGHIKAWVGGVDFKNFKYDHVNFRRQVGSTIKPFVYATAIGVQGLSPCHEYEDIQYTIAPGDANLHVSEEWTPSNANGIFTGNKYNLYQGLFYSKNSITVRIVKEMGTVEPIRDLLDNVGISKTERYYNGRLLIPNVPSICLGSVDLSLMEITGGYTTFANDGIFTQPIFVDRVEDKNGRIIYRSAIQQKVAINPFYNGVMLDMLQNNTGGGRGMGLKSPTGGKTGTTNDFADGWFIGITPTLVTGIWVGGDEKWVKFFTLDDGQGFVMSRPIFQIYMKRLEEDVESLYDFEAKFPKSASGLAEFIDCARYKQGEPEDEFARHQKEDVMFDEFDESEFDDFEEDFEELQRDTIGI
jgi:penicillin-binding protein 1A